ncbi:MAG: isomerizing glutamine--fructose-6-phosphate transaminase [Acidobacteriaceae bacterium]
MQASDQQNSVFKHSMLKEIYEQPRAIFDTIARYIRNNELNEEQFAPVRNWVREHSEIVIAASGSSRHAGLAGEIMIEDLSGIAVDVEYASEYCYRSVNTLRNPAVVVISQSGETADTLAALREAVARKHGTLAITNVHGSTMAREADVALPTCAGVEKAIPATKSFTTQLVVLYLLALAAAEERGTLDKAAIAKRIQDLQALPELVEGQLSRWEKDVEAIADAYCKAATFLYLGRGIHYAMAREGALKLKESSYVHAEGYPTGELKHGPNALVSDKTPLIVLATVDKADTDSVLRYEKTVQLLRDMKAQGARVLAIANEGDTEVAELSSHCIFVAPTTEYLLPICEVIPLQMLAYFVAIKNGIDVDRPRNLVKAVVTE